MIFMITVIFSSHNGADTIGRMFECFCEITQPPVAFEVLMINNGSQDATVSIAESYKKKLPLKILHQNRLGKNIALNYGIDYAKGDLLVFTDDDVLPQKNWLNIVWRCAEQNRDINLFGGRILPYWVEKPSVEFLKSVPLTAAYGVTPDELCEGPVNAGAIWGANMFVRKRVFERGFRFDERVGPGPGNYIMGSEVEFNLRLADHGYTAWYCPDAIVQHIILKHETTKRWLKKRAQKFGKGVCSRDLKRINSGQITSVIGFELNFPRWMIRKFMSEWLLSLKYMFLRDISKEIKHLWSAYHHLGCMIQGFNSKKN